MKPARQGKGDRTRRRVLDAAAGLFARHGIAAVSMGEVAAAVGLQAGSLYFHVPSKAKLVEEVLAQGAEEGLAHVRRAIGAARAAGASPAERLRVAIEAHLVALHRISDYSSVIAQSVAARTVGGGPDVTGPERRYAGMWLGLLDEARSAGVLAPDADLRLVRDLVFGAMNSPTLRDREPAHSAATLAVLIGIMS